MLAACFRRAEEDSGRARLRVPCCSQRTYRLQQSALAKTCSCTGRKTPQPHRQQPARRSFAQWSDLLASHATLVQQRSGLYLLLQPPSPRCVVVKGNAGHTA